MGYGMVLVVLLVASCDIVKRTIPIDALFIAISFHIPFITATDS